MIEALHELGLSDLAIGAIGGGGAMLVAVWVLAPYLAGMFLDVRPSEAEKLAVDVRERLEGDDRTDRLP